MKRSEAEVFARLSAMFPRVEVATRHQSGEKFIAAYNHKERGLATKHFGSQMHFLMVMPEDDLERLLEKMLRAFAAPSAAHAPRTVLALSIGG